MKSSFDVPFGFEFKMYFYGPYSENLSDALQLLKSVELVNEEKIEIADRIVHSYGTSEIANKFLETYFFKDRKSRGIYDKIRSGVEKMSRLPTNYLVSLSKKHYVELEKAFFFHLREE